MGKKNKLVCYRCEDEGTTKEHFPPRSFFPEKGKGLQLTTVRSCKLHNNDKSGDDEYVLAHICINTARDENLPKSIFLDRLLRAFERSPKFKSTLTAERQKHSNGAYRYPVDIVRFDNFFESLTCAVYFNKFHERFNPETHSLNHLNLSLESEDPTDNFQKGMFDFMWDDFFSEHRSFIETFEADSIDEMVYRNEIIAPGGMDVSITILHSFYSTFKVAAMLTRRISDLAP